MKLQVDVTTSRGDFVASNIVDSQAEADSWLAFLKKSLNNPADIVVTQTDVTQQYADYAMIERGVAAQAVGRRCVALAYAINAQKKVTPTQLNAMFADSTLAMAERLLKNGALLTGKLLLQSVSRVYFTDDEIKRCTDLIDKSGLI